MLAVNEIECNKNSISPQCQYFVVRKKRLCRMTVRSGRQYCGEHEPHPSTKDGQGDVRIPCPNDPKHTCYASKLEKHLAICNARAEDPPSYIVMNINAPQVTETQPTVLLSQIPKAKLELLLDKINYIYNNYIENEIEIFEQQEIHEAVKEDFKTVGRTERSLRHLRQVSALLQLTERRGLLRPGSVYVELGAGKGHLSYYAWLAWCAQPGSDSGVVLVDRAALRHKRDNRLPKVRRKTGDSLINKSEVHSLEKGDCDGNGITDTITPKIAFERKRNSEVINEETQGGGVCRVRADVAHVKLRALPAVARAAHVVGLAKHLCGCATDYAARCLAAAGASGVVMATCCHHRCSVDSLLGVENLTRLGVERSEVGALLRLVSWATCGHGRARDAPPLPTTKEWASRAAVGARAKAALDWARAAWLRQQGLRTSLCRFVPAHVTPENLCIIATADVTADTNTIDT
ncbi:hypothetical protein ACJJTC_015110 [Scirpophaga incertulas]